jgi:hypothetical protein
VFCEGRPFRGHLCRRMSSRKSAIAAADAPNPSNTSAHRFQQQRHYLRHFSAGSYGAPMEEERLAMALAVYQPVGTSISPIAVGHA